MDVGLSLAGFKCFSFTVYNNFTWEIVAWAVIVSDVHEPLTWGVKKNQHWVTYCDCCLLLVETFFFLPPELIGAVTECLFLYCNPIELFDIFLPAVSDTWLQQDLIWCEFGLLSFSQTSLFAILCRHPCTNLICETANIICICYPWLLS